MRTLNAFVKANLGVFTAIFITLVAWATFRQHWIHSLFSSQFLPHQFCYLQEPGLIWTNAISDGLIWLAYIAIAIELAVLLWKAKDLLPFRWAFVSFGLFILACGFTHFMEVVTVWNPLYWLSAFIKVLTAIASVGTAIALVTLIPEAATAVALFHDTHQRAELERDEAVSRVAELEERRRIAVEASGIGTWEMDAKTGWISWDQRSASMFGVPVNEQLHYDKFLRLIHPEDRARTEEAVSTALERSGEYQTEYRVVAGDGVTRNVVARGKAFYDSDGRTPNRFIGTVLDVTAQRESEAALIRSEKLAVAGRMAATIAHEINNPISSSLNLLHLMKSTSGLPGTARDYVEIAEQELYRAAEITRNSLTYHRESATSVPVDIAHTVGSVVQLQQVKLQKCGIKVAARCTKTPNVQGFPGELRQVFTNLVVNAIDAMENSERRTLLVRVHAMTTSAGPACVAIVADTGAGISSDIQKRLFSPFFTTKGEAGTGLGLWVVRQLIARHGGTIRLRSKVGKGTVMRITLPAGS